MMFYYQDAENRGRKPKISQYIYYRFLIPGNKDKQV